MPRWSDASPAERFWKYVDFTPTCWVWTGAIASTRGGYARFKPIASQSPVRGHRWIFEQLYGPLSRDVKVCHSCDNPPCVRPDHLFLGTAKDNVQDMLRKGRGARTDQKRGRAKLSLDQVSEIRRRRAKEHATTRQLANEFGIHPTTINRLLSGRSFRTD